MARVPLDPTAPRGLSTRLLLTVARCKYGADLDTTLAIAHRPPLLRAWGTFELQNQRLRSVLPDHLADLVVFVSAVRIGCSWCVDFGASLWEAEGLDPGVLRDAARWRDRDAFDEPTRAAFEYAEAVCADPVAVDDELARRVRESFGDDGLVEITYWAALENMRSRFNHALGLTSQGFSSGEVCEPARVGDTASRAGG